MSTDSVADPHDMMRARDVNRVARGEQAPWPAGEHPIVSKAPLPTSTNPKPKKAGEEDDDYDDDHAPCFTNQLRNCCIRYYEFSKLCENHNCVGGLFGSTLENEGDASKCDKFAQHYRALCPYEWIEKWDGERELGIFPGPI